MKSFTYLLLLGLLIAGVIANNNNEDEPDKVPDTLYETPKPNGPVVFLETFNDDHWTNIWKPSTNPKFDGDWKVQESEYVRVSGDRGLVVGTVAKHHAIGALFPSPLDNTGKDLVIQYEVQTQNGLECGGAYLKLLTASKDLDITAVNSDSAYTIMFGPDKCGSENKVHFILRHENPKNHTIEEKHMMPRPQMITNKLTHLYTLHIKKDNSFEMFIDLNSVKSGNLLTDMEPPINPPKEIDDVTDVKPSDWVDDELIPDVEATKPEDWDENEPAKIEDPTDSKPEGWLDDATELIADPKASKPEDWDDEEDGEWTAPLIPNPACEEHGCGEWKARQIKNPKYKGKWVRPKVKNPLFKGVWAPRKVPNPDFFEDLHPSNFPKIAGIAFELWTMSDGILFDNILITHDKAVAYDFAEKTWLVKNKAEAEKLNAERPLGSEDGEGFVATLKEYAELVYQGILENPYVAGAALVLGLLPVFVCSALSSSSPSPSSRPAARASASSSPSSRPAARASASSSASSSSAASNETTETKEEIEEITEEKAKSKKSPVTRKRVPRASE